MGNSIENHDWISSVYIAKSILDSNPSLITSKEWDRQSLGDVKFDLNKSVPLHFSVLKFLPLVKDILRKYIGADSLSLKVLKIDTRYILNGDKNTIAGIFLKESMVKYGVLINSGESYCTQRLSLCKELCEIFVGCIIDNPSTEFNPHSAILEAVRELTNKFYSDSHIPKLTDKFKSTETFAHSIALELMIPYTRRAEITKMVNEKVGIVKIAETLRITEETMEYYLNNYYKLTTEAYDYFK